MQIREATEQDIPGILAIFHAVYGDDYPYTQFYDPTWLKRAVFGDDILMLAAVDQDVVLFRNLAIGLGLKLRAVTPPRSK